MDQSPPAGSMARGRKSGSWIWTTPSVDEVPQRVRAGSDLLRGEERAAQAQRLQDQLVHCGAVLLTGYGLHEPPQQDEPGIVVAEELPEGRKLRQLGEPVRHVLLDGVVAIAGVDEEVAPPAAGVGQQVTHRHPLRDLLVRQPKIGQVGPHRRLQVERAVLDEAHHGRPGDGLGDRPGLKQRVGRHRIAALDAGDPEHGVLFPPLGQDAERRPRRARGLHGADQRLGHGPKRRRRVRRERAPTPLSSALRWGFGPARGEQGTAAEAGSRRLPP